MWEGWAESQKVLDALIIIYHDGSLNFVCPSILLGSAADSFRRTSDPHLIDFPFLCAIISIYWVRKKVSAEVRVKILFAILGVVLIILLLWDAFETIVLPRRVTRKYRLTRLFYRYTWMFWSFLIKHIAKGKRQETYLSYYGPLSLIILLSIWAAGAVLGFALLNWGMGSPVNTPEGTAGFATDLYLSGTTFFTLGLGDVRPVTACARALTVIESGIGLGLLALVIGYLPALNQSFSRREVNISLLDARAGSPPTAAGMLLRQCRHNMSDALLHQLGEWELWASEIMESHLSYPVLVYFRSQHDNQSWVAALTAILDTCALVITGMEGSCARQAELTFAIARHAIIDLSLVLNRPPHEPKHDRLPAAELFHLRAALADAGIVLRKGEDVDRHLLELRMMYEPYVYSMSQYLGLGIPPWIAEPGRLDNWQTSAWEPGVKKKRGEEADEHF